MSQSDYIQLQRNATILRNQSDLESILTSDELMKFKSFAIKNTTVNTRPTYGQLLTTGKQRIMNMEVPVNNCSPFIVCKNTGQRPNRKVTMTDLMGKRGYTRHHGYNEYIMYNKVNNKIAPCKMFKKCDEYYYLRRTNPEYEDDDIEVIIGGV
jgi:hypothetical protein